MRVSLINLNLVAQDAVGMCLIYQARFFMRRGDDVRVFVCHPPEGAPEDVKARTSVVTLADLVGGRAPHFAQSDLYIYHYPSRHPLMESIKGLARGVVIFYYHNVTPPDLWGSAEGRDVLARGVEGISLVHYADLALADSPFNADELIERAGFERGRTRVLPLAVSLERFLPGPKDAELVERYRLAGRRVLLFVGRMAGNKRIDLLVEALPMIKTAVPYVKLLLVGDYTPSVYRESVDRARARAAELGVVEEVVFTGRVDDLPAHYRLADVYVTASLHEGFGVPLIEAMASGVPVVAANAAAMPWVVGDAGRLCQPGDARDLAEQAIAILRDDALRGDLARRGLERVQEFSLERYEAGLLRAVMELTEPGYVPDARSSSQTSSLDAVSWLVAAERTRAEATLYADVAGLNQMADVAMRGYVVSSGAPLVGPLIAWVRRNLTSHLREPYLDPIVERQVKFNQRASELLDRAVETLAQLVRQTVGALARRVDAIESHQSVIEARAELAADTEARLRLIERRLDVVSLQVALLEAERSISPGDQRMSDLHALRAQVEALRAVLNERESGEGQKR